WGLLARESVGIAPETLDLCLISERLRISLCQARRSVFVHRDDERGPAGRRVRCVGVVRCGRCWPDEGYPPDEHHHDETEHRQPVHLFDIITPRYKSTVTHTEFSGLRRESVLSPLQLFVVFREGQRTPLG